MQPVRYSIQATPTPTTTGVTTMIDKYGYRFKGALKLATYEALVKLGYTARVYYTQVADGVKMVSAVRWEEPETKAVISVCNTGIAGAYVGIALDPNIRRDGKMTGGSRAIWDSEYGAGATLDTIEIEGFNKTARMYMGDEYGYEKQAYKGFEGFDKDHPMLTWEAIEHGEA